jgi:hypothetical protein
MKEDILEQIVDDYLNFRGYFTIHNVKFRPSATDPEYSSRDDCVASDVDVIGLNPQESGADRVWVVSCKSWQDGFSPKDTLRCIENGKPYAGRDAWRGFRELCKKKWADALIDKVQCLTGTAEFTYITAVTKLWAGQQEWEANPLFKANLRGNAIRILTLQDMLSDLYANINTTVAASEVGRLLQVVKASGWKP